MRVFVTGASGFVGSAVVAELTGAGHRVLGLARSAFSAAKLRAMGAEVHPGDLDDVTGLRAGAAQADAVIHAGFIHDFSRMDEVCEVEGRALNALGAELAGSGRPLVITSGAALGLNGGMSVESYVPSRVTHPFPRVITEETAARLATEAVDVRVLRLAISTHGVGDHGFVPMLIAVARRKGVAAYVGDGTTLWHAVHRLDAARLYRLVLEGGKPGARYHAVAEQGVPFRAIAEAIGRGLGLPAVSLGPEQAAEHFGFLGMFAGRSLPASSDWTRGQLNWAPREPGLIADLNGAGGYFAA